MLLDSTKSQAPDTEGAMDRLVDLLYASAHDDALWTEVLDELRSFLSLTLSSLRAERIGGANAGPGDLIALKSPRWWSRRSISLPKAVHYAQVGMNRSLRYVWLSLNSTSKIGERVCNYHTILRVFR